MGVRLKQKAILSIGLWLVCLLVACGGESVLPTAVNPATIPPNNQSTAVQPANPPVPSDNRPFLPPLLGQTYANESNNPTDTAVGVVVAHPFAHSTFTLHAELPATPDQTAVWRQIPQPAPSAEQARQLAHQFGFTGPLYSQNMHQEQSPTYYAFDGRRTFIIDPLGAAYEADSSALTSYQAADLATALPVAEQFLQHYQLADFPYTLEQNSNGDVAVHRLIDGRRLNQAELVLAVNNQQEVAFASYYVLPNLEYLHDYPLISAQTAWEQLQSGVASNRIDYQLTYPYNPTATTDQSWQRTYNSGETAQLYGWPIAYQPLDQGAPPHVQLFPYVLQADPELLNQIATAVGQPIMVTGQIAADGRSLQVQTWQPAEQAEPLNLEGRIRYQDDQPFLDSEEGISYPLAPLPAEIADGTPVFVFAWQPEATEAEPLLLWQRIDYWDDGQQTTVEAEPDNSQISITAVELAYYVTYLMSESSDQTASFTSPSLLVQPVWQFSGTAVSGHAVTIFVQAVDEAFIQP